MGKHYAGIVFEYVTVVEADKSVNVKGGFNLLSACIGESLQGSEIEENANGRRIVGHIDGLVGAYLKHPSQHSTEVLSRVP